MRDSRRSRGDTAIGRRVKGMRVGAVVAAVLTLTVGVALAVFMAPSVLERGAVYFNGETATGIVTDNRVVAKRSGPDSVMSDVREVFVSYSVDGRTFGIWMSDNTLAIDEEVTIHYAVSDPAIGHPDSPGGRFLGSLVPLAVPPFLVVFGIRLLLGELRASSR